nr:T9SS type A sorting domain-containing protein [uncultured Flavobacterium sp.]
MKKITLLAFLFISILTQAQTFSESFDANTGTNAAFTKTISGIVFNFTFTTDGDGGMFTWKNNKGENGSPSISVESGSYKLTTDEKITIKRADGKKFKFTSIYYNNGSSPSINIAGYDNNVLVGSIKNVTMGFAGVINFNDIDVDEVRIVSNDFYDSSFDSFIGKFTATLGVDDVNFSDAKIVVSPNPANDYLMVSGLKNTENFSIYNVLGSKIFDGIIDNDKKIDLKSLSNGVYFLKFENNKTIKFIKN